VRRFRKQENLKDQEIWSHKEGRKKQILEKMIWQCWLSRVFSEMKVQSSHPEREVRAGVRSIPGFSECCPTTLHLHTDCRVCQLFFTAQLQNLLQRTAAQVVLDLLEIRRLIHSTAGKFLPLKSDTGRDVRQGNESCPPPSFLNLQPLPPVSNLNFQPTLVSIPTFPPAPKFLILIFL